ncbi:J domain-containing protein [Streptomyces griseoaurantiacus]|uniref:hypothetical protein n=1 Tax=Streptomyces griseoaurantiacus TaxID=68213 RepID=UPI00369C4BEC
MSRGLRIVGPPENAVLSTSTALEPAPPRPAPVVHDVNGYYATLGVPTDATRRQLREAYQALDGQSSVELTRIFKTLINPKLRAAYDAQQTATTYFDASSVEILLRQAALHAARQNAEHGTEITARDILSTLAERLGKPILEFLASPSTASFHDEGTRGRQPSPPLDAWAYSYLLLDSTCDDVDRLAQWQQRLARALADRDCPQFTVGFHGIPGRPFLVAKDLGTPVFFLHEERPVTEELIAAAATAAFL